MEHISVTKLRRQALFWLLATVIFIAFLYIFRSILLPFFAGFVLAYFLDPVADWLERKGMSRLWSTVTILIAFILVFVLALLVVVPVLSTQLLQFADKVPGYVVRLREVANSLSISVPWLGDILTNGENSISSSIDSLVKEGAGFLGSIAQGIWTSASALVNVAGLLVVTPVVAFYMLLDWDRMVAKIDGWIPRQHVETVREIGRDINRAVAGFVRGQGTVCLILGIFYGVGLTLVGLNFGLLIGLFSGLISFIPYVGSLVGLVLSVGVALVQFWPGAEGAASEGSFISIGLVAGVFFIGQFIEGNVLQPKLVGNSVGLHPVWLMFALFAFGSLLGFTGMVIAVPAAAAIAVLVRFALRQYLDSDLYENLDGDGK